MSLFVDIKYLQYISNKLPGFKKKSEYLWNCRCIKCGDSAKKRTKLRGYFYRQKNDLFYKCHNCSISIHFSTFLKELDPNLYGQYVFEKFEQVTTTTAAPDDFEKSVKFEQPKFKSSLLNKVAVQLGSNTPETAAGETYCILRKIPKEKWSQLWFLHHVKDIVQIAPKYADTLTSPEPRLLIPFRSREGDLTGVALRSLSATTTLRYINVKLVEDAPLIFGLNNAKFDKDIMVVEGAIDSLFLSNAIACAGTSFGKIESLDLPKDRLIIVFDNQPRNKEVCKLVERYIHLDYRVCIWPSGVRGKDVNEMILNGLNPQEIIEKNTYQGLMAKIKFTEWRN